MKKKFLSVLLAFCMALTLLPMTALAVGVRNCTDAACSHKAAIGDTHYDTLQEAIDAAGTTPTTIKVIYNITSDTRVATISDGADITIDLNGKEITSSYDPYTIAVQKPDDTAFGQGTATTGKLTIIGTGKIGNTSAGSTTIRNYGTLIIGESGSETGPEITRGTTTNSAGNSAVKCDEGTTLVIYSGTIAGDARSLQSMGTATIYGGTFKKAVQTWEYQNNPSALTIYGGTFEGAVENKTGAEGGNYASSPETDIYGGSFTDENVNLEGMLADGLKLGEGGAVVRAVDGALGVAEETTTSGPFTVYTINNAVGGMTYTVQTVSGDGVAISSFDMPPQSTASNPCSFDVYMNGEADEVTVLETAGMLQFDETGAPITSNLKSTVDVYPPAA